MKKFILVVFIGIVLAINIYGIVTKFMVEETTEVDHIKESTIVVHME